MRDPVEREINEKQKQKQSLINNLINVTEKYLWFRSRYSLFFEGKNVYMKFSKKRSIFVFSISSWIQPSFFRFMLLFKIYYYYGILKMTKFYFLNVLFRIPSFQEFNSIQFYIIHHMKRRIKGTKQLFCYIIISTPSFYKPKQFQKKWLFHSFKSSEFHSSTSLCIQLLKTPKRLLLPK